MKTPIRKRAVLGVTLAALAVGSAACTSGGSGGSNATASGDTIGLPSGVTQADLNGEAVKALTGKTVGFVPAALGVPLTDAWNAEFKQTFADLGIKYSVKDPGLDPQKQVQAVQSFIAEKPDVLIVHNLDVGLLADKLKEAQDAGIYVVQLNLQSSTVTDAYVGPDFGAEGRLDAKLVATKCSGKEVAVLRAIPGASADDEVYKAFVKGTKDAGIKIVSTQTAGFDPAKAASLLRAILVKNPDLCGVFGTYDEMMVGAGTALNQAGKSDDVAVWTTGSGDAACRGVKDGTFTGATASNGRRVAIMATAVTQELLQSNVAAGASKMVYRTPITSVTRDNYFAPNVCFNVEK